MRDLDPTKPPPDRSRRPDLLRFAVWGMLSGAAIGTATCPDHFSLDNLARFIGVSAAGGGWVGAIVGLVWSMRSVG